MSAIPALIIVLFLYLPAFADTKKPEDICFRLNHFTGVPAHKIVEYQVFTPEQVQSIKDKIIVIEAIKALLDVYFLDWQGRLRVEECVKQGDPYLVLISRISLAHFIQILIKEFGLKYADFGDRKQDITRIMEDFYRFNNKREQFALPLPR